MSSQMPGFDAVVTLREVTEATFRDIVNLSVGESQKQFVAPNVYSIAQAYFNDKAWFRAIYADETPVGFVMLHDDTEKQEYFLWRFMIDERYQKLKYGRKALDLLINHVKTRPGAKELGVSYVLAEGGPEWFYRKAGFAPTGEMEENEVVARLVFDSPENANA